MLYINSRMIDDIRDIRRPNVISTKAQAQKQYYYIYFFHLLLV